ncbi:MAG: IS4 family transposase [Terracidiphilus sp.]
MSTVCSIFSQVLKLIPRATFDGAVREHKAERNAKGFTCWGQLVAMLFCQLGSVNSLRDITNGLAASEGKLRHLGLPAAPKRSTLAYANAHRPSALFEDLFYRTLEIARGQAQQSGVRHKFRFNNKLLSIDATTIELCASVFDWAQFRRTKGAVKLHLMLDHDGLLPCYGVITDGKQHEVTVTRQWEFAPGTILVFDRGYTDYNWFERLTQQGVYFVTRLKTNADIIEVEDRALPQRKGLVSDQIICMTQQAIDNDNPPMMRRIEFFDEQQQRTLVFLTNNMKLAAATVAEIYKNRWQIELFFKALKQSCKVKTFVGTSANALKTQIWTALIAMLLVKILHMKSTFGWHLSNFMVLLRQQLFVYRDLWKWIDDPFQAPETPLTPQLQLAFA